MRKEKIYYGLYFDLSNIELANTQEKEITILIDWCEEKNIFYSYEKVSYRNAILRISILGNKWIVNNEFVDGKLLDFVSTYKFVPLVCIENFDKNKFEKHLAEIDCEYSKYYKSTLEKYNLIFNKNFEVTGGVDDIVEKYSGGIIFQDYEWFLMENNSLKALFECRDSNDSNIYSTQLDNGIMLRGAEVYYYFVCFANRYKYTTKDIVYKWIKNTEVFINKVEEALNNFEVKNAFDRRLLLGVIDNIRNIELLAFNAAIITYYEGDNVVTNIQKEEPEYIYSWEKIIESTLNGLKDICMNNKENSAIKDEVVGIIAKVKKLYPKTMNYVVDNNEEGLTFEKCCGLLRDADNFWENYIVIEESIQAITAKKKIEKPIELIGILTGGVELPFIAKMILKSTYNVNISYAYQNNGMYMDKQEIDMNFYYNNIKCDYYSYYNGKEVIIIDDNIMSGLTMQLVVNELVVQGVEVNEIISIFRPDLNRISQIEHFNKVYNYEGIGKLIYGMLGKLYYTKISEKFSYLDMFTDGMGMYSQRISSYVIPLYKNRCFKKDSYVDVIKGYIEGRE